MILRIAHREKGFTQISNQTLQDETLTWKARGILAYLLSLPEDWRVYATEVATRSPQGLAALTSGIKELEKAGYIRKELVRDKSGKFEGYQYIVYERPVTETYTDREEIYKTHIPEMRLSINGKPVNGKPVNGKSHTTNKHLTNTQTTNTQETNIQKDGHTECDGISHKEMVKALEKVTGLDMKIKSNAGRIVRASKELRQAGYTPEDVISYGVAWRQDWRYLRNHKAPSLTTLIAEISKPSQSITETDIVQEYRKSWTRK